MSKTKLHANFVRYNSIFKIGVGMNLTFDPRYNGQKLEVEETYVGFLFDVDTWQ